MAGYILCKPQMPDLSVIKNLIDAVNLASRDARFIQR